MAYNKKALNKGKHRKVAETMLQKPANKNIVMHLDGNPENNNPANLAWGTTQENVAQREQDKIITDEFGNVYPKLVQINAEYNPSVKDTIIEKREFGGDMKKKTPKKILNKIMPIKADAGAQVNLPPTGDGRWDSTPHVTPPPPPTPNPDPNAQARNNKYSKNPQPPITPPNPLEPLDLTEQEQSQKPWMDVNWNWKPNSAHYGNLANIDISNGIKNVSNLAAAALPDTRRKSNQKLLSYGYNPTPNGSGTQAAYADGGIVPISSEERDAWERMQTSAYQEGFYGNDHNKQIGVDFMRQHGVDPSRLSAYQQDFLDKRNSEALRNTDGSMTSMVRGTHGGFSGADDHLGTLTSGQRYLHHGIDNNGKYTDFGTNYEKFLEASNAIPDPSAGWENYGKTQPVADYVAPELTQAPRMTGLADTGFPTREEAIAKYQSRKASGQALPSNFFEEDTKKQRKMKGSGDPIGMVRLTGEDVYAYGGELNEFPEEAAYGIRMMGEGSIKPISSNPYSDAILEHVGASHEDGGITHAQFGKKIETEGGETQFRNTIFGNMTFPKVDGMSVDGFTGKKFKNIGKTIADDENKAQRVATKGKALLQGDPTNKYGSLAVNSGIAIADAASQKQRSLTQQKELVARIQQGMLDLSDYTGVKPEKMHKEFRKGGIIAEDGYTYDSHGGRGFDEEKAKALGYNGPKDTKSFQAFLNEKYPEQVKQVGVGSKSGKWDDGIWGKRTDAITDAALASRNPNYIAPLEVHPALMNTKRVSDATPLDPAALRMLKAEPPQQTEMKPIPGDRIPRIEKETIVTKSKKKSLADYNKLSGWDLLSSARYLLDQPDQVVSQQYNPQLMSPYQVSFQDRINRNNAAFKTIAQQAPNNIAALSTAAGANYTANNEVSAEEFRANQTIFNNVMNNNYALMNEAAKMNIQLNDQQMVRQAQAKAITDQHKAQALAHIADTIDKNRYENMNIRLVEARHKYTYDPKTNQSVLNPGTEAAFDFSGNRGSSQNKTIYHYGPDGELQGYDVTDASAADDELKRLNAEKAQRNAYKKWGGMFK